MKAFFKAVWRFFFDLFWKTPEEDSYDPENDPPPNPDDCDDCFPTADDLEREVVTPPPAPARPVTPPPPPPPMYRIVTIGGWRFLQFNADKCSDWRLIPLDGLETMADFELYPLGAPKSLSMSIPLLCGTDEHLMQWAEQHPDIEKYFEWLRARKAERIAALKKPEEETKYL